MAFYSRPAVAFLRRASRGGALGVSFTKAFPQPLASRRWLVSINQKAGAPCHAHYLKEKHNAHHFSTETLIRGLGVIPGDDAVAQKMIKTVEERAKKRDIKFLLSRPSHEVQARTHEIKEIDDLFESLRQVHTDSVVSVFLQGAPACGKTQLARQYGDMYFNKRLANKERSFKKKITIVGTLDVRNESSLWRSYYRLANDLHDNVQAQGQLEDRLAVLKSIIRKSFQENPGWLLIIDGVNERMAREFEDYWPQPNSEDWGTGHVLVTTSFRDLAKKHDSNNYAKKYECPEMTQNDAVNLLQKMTGNYEKGAIDVVNTTYINKNPLDIASAAIIMKEKKSTNSKYSYGKFIEDMVTGGPDVETLRHSSLAEAVKTLAASDDDLKKVFTAMGMCAHDPIPLCVMDKVLGKDTSTLDSVNGCPLLSKIPEQHPPIDNYDAIPRIYTHYCTLTEFRNELITKKDRSLQSLQRLLAKSMLEEYNRVSISETAESKWVQTLLFRHLQQLLHHEEDKSHYLDSELKIRLAATLSNAHIDLNQNPEKSKQILANLEKEFKTEDLNPYNKTILNLSWAKIYRHLCQYESSAARLSDAMNGIDHVYNQLTDSDASECLKECTALSMMYHSSGYDERENLIKAINLYTKLLEDRGSKQLLGEAKCGLSHICLKMGEWSQGEEYMQEAEQLLDIKEDIDISRAYENLAVVYNEIGDHEKSIEIIGKLIVQYKKSFYFGGKPFPILSIPYARLCSAYYYNGDREKAHDAIKDCVECLDAASSSKGDSRSTALMEQSEVAMKRPYIPPWTATHIITTLLCDFGDIRYPMNNLVERIENSKFEDTPLLLGRLHRHRGYYQQAEKILEQHLRECGGGRKDTIRIGLAWAELGKVYREQGYIIRGLKAFENAYEIFKQFYVSSKHPEVAFMQAELGRVVQLNGNKKLGMEMMKEAVDICQEHYENETCRSKNLYVGIKYAQMLAAFGIVLRYDSAPDKMNEALEYLYKALSLQDSTLDANSIHRIRTLHYIGLTLQKQGDFDEARKNMAEALHLLGTHNHPYKASILTGLGRLLQRDEPEYAENCMKDAFFIRKNREFFSSEAHWKVAFAYQNVGELMRDRGAKKEAYHNFMKANNMFVQLIERESLEKEQWLDSRSSSAPDYGIDIIDRWGKDQETISKEIGKLIE